MLACRTALLERMPVFETKPSEQIPNGEVPTQQEPETVTKEGTFELLSFQYHMKCGIRKKLVCGTPFTNQRPGRIRLQDVEGR